MGCDSAIPLRTSAGDMLQARKARDVLLKQPGCSVLRPTRSFALLLARQSGGRAASPRLSERSREPAIAAGRSIDPGQWVAASHRSSVRRFPYMHDTQASQTNTNRFGKGEMARSASPVQLLVFMFLQVADSVQHCQTRQSRQQPGGTGAWSAARVSGSADR